MKKFKISLWAIILFFVISSANAYTTAVCSTYNNGTYSSGSFQYVCCLFMQVYLYDQWVSATDRSGQTADTCYSVGGINIDSGCSDVQSVFGSSSNTTLYTQCSQQTDPGTNAVCFDGSASNCQQDPATATKIK